MSPAKKQALKLDLKARVFELASFVNYQEGSVVSRELIRQPGGTVTVFAFDEGQGLSEHRAPFDALVVVIEGLAEVTISGRSYELRGGEMIIMPAGEPHSLKARQKFKMVLVMIRS